jgi:hypothetical protein
MKPTTVYYAIETYLEGAPIVVGGFAACYGKGAQVFRVRELLTNRVFLEAVSRGELDGGWHPFHEVTPVRAKRLKITADGVVTTVIV